ncbi:MAG: Fructokinase [Syntrophorhabdus sp. PtaU1.Bin050]|nr:MAG: Fructokinase [Syntrophorhabdus sp. PtaU1.Bin050]
MLRIGVDLGGTKIEIVALGEDNKELLRDRVPTPQDNYDAIVRTIADLVAVTETRIGQKGSVGIGTPGAISQTTGLLKNSNSTCLNGRPLFQDLELTLARPIRMENDANCFALSEALDGAGKGKQVVFGVIVGTGTGGGIAVNGTVLKGANAITGEWGHNPLPWPRENEIPGPECYCGKSGCIETFLSGPGMSNDHQRVIRTKLTPEAILTGASRGDMPCEETVQRYEDRMARSLAHVINILDPDIIVLGGGISNINRLYENVPKLWGNYIFSDKVETVLAPAMHGDASGVRGAALLWD